MQLTNVRNVFSIQTCKKTQEIYKNERKLLRFLCQADLKELQKKKKKTQFLSQQVIAILLHIHVERPKPPQTHVDAKRRSGQERKGVKLKETVLCCSNKMDLSANQGLIAAAKAQIPFFPPLKHHLAHCARQAPAPALSMPKRTLMGFSFPLWVLQQILLRPLAAQDIDGRPPVPFFFSDVSGLITSRSQIAFPWSGNDHCHR